MDKRNIIVIGASAGGFDAIKQLVATLPAGMDAAIFIVWHMSPDVTGILPQVINKQNTIHAANAIDQEPLVFNRIYVAPPDHHLMLEKDTVRVTKGPKENRFRPAVDPLFRSAAYAYGSRVIGVVLSGALDDGTAGLWTIKNSGGIAIVQDPLDAVVPSMPENAIAAVEVDHIVSIDEMAPLLVKLAAEQVSEAKNPSRDAQQKTGTEVDIAMQKPIDNKSVFPLGSLTPFSCPECHGVLTGITEGTIIRYRCHTGHAYSADSLLASITEKIEDYLWNAIRGVEESIYLLNHIGDHYSESNQPQLAAMYFKKAKEAEEKAKTMKKAVLNHEQLTANIIKLQAEKDNGI